MPTAAEVLTQLRSGGGQKRTAADVLAELRGNNVSPNILSQDSSATPEDFQVAEPGSGPVSLDDFLPALEAPPAAAQSTNVVPQAAVFDLGINEDNLPPSARYRATRREIA